MSRNVSEFVLALAVVLGLSASTAVALINPNFTPVHVAKESALVLELRIGPAKDGKVAAQITRVLKGKSEAKTLELNLSACKLDEHVKTLTKMLNVKEPQPAIFFAGEFVEAGGAGGGPGDAPPGAAGEGGGAQKAQLHTAGTWFAFDAGKGAQWDLVKLNEGMSTTWNGGTDMLIRATEYILANPDDAVVPVIEGVRWSAIKDFGKVQGAVHAALPVDLAGDGKLTLYLACDGGDKLFRYDAKADNMVDVTGAAKLAAKSKVAAWGDFNADGRMDLLSFDGEAMAIHTQAADATFTAGEKLLKGALPDGCLGLTIIESAKAGAPAVLIATKAAPMLWIPTGPAPTSIGGPFAGAELGVAATCVVADFDGDALPDILQLLEKGSLIYKGKGGGEFEAPKRCAPAVGATDGRTLLGDFDADGMLDVFTIAPQGASRMWNNRGKFEFSDTISATGEVPYKGARDAIGGSACDFNNDGRQDLVFFYGGGAPQLYFNRGFRSFGMANGLDPAGAEHNLPQAADGQQAGCVADFTGNGAQVVVTILKGGAAWALYTEAGEGRARCARVMLSSKGPHIGPLTVTASQSDRSLGAWNVTAGTNEAFFGRTEAGPITLKWQFPGGNPQQKEIIIENAPVRVVLTP